MKRRADSLSDATIRESRQITVTGRVIGDYKLSSSEHALIVAVPADALISIGDPK